jgi:hypothetical protein
MPDAERKEAIYVCFSKAARIQSKAIYHSPEEILSDMQRVARKNL